MSGLFGGANTKVSTASPVIAGVQLQTSAYGRPIPWVFGKTRIAGNLLGYWDFTAVPHTTTTETGGAGGKGGGGSVTQESTTYTYTAAALMLLCRGAIHSVPRVWKDKDVSTPAALGLSLYTGSTTQTAFPHLSTNHPADAYAYRGLAYVASAAWSLGDNAQFGNHNFEVRALLPFSADIHDANPADVIEAIASDPAAGAGIPSALIGDLSQFSDFCVAHSVFVAPAYLEPRAAGELITALADIGNAEVVCSEETIKLVPYGDEAATGNGVTFTPDTTPVFDLDDRDYVQEAGKAPVEFLDEDSSDAANIVQVKFRDRALDYAENTVEAKDEDDIALNGERSLPSGVVDFPEIVDRDVAQAVAWRILQRKLYQRIRYRFRMGPGKADLLEPMDLLTLTETRLGLSLAPVRVMQIEEESGGRGMSGYRITVRECPTGSSHSALYPSPETTGGGVDFNATAGDSNAPVIFDAPAALAVSGYELWMAVSGESTDWGGAQVWVATESGGPYKQVGVVRGGARHGTLSAIFASGSDPDTTHAASVDLAISRGVLQGGTAADADNLSLLAWIEGELISFQTATQTGDYAYDLEDYIRRGVYNTTIGAHGTGQRFVRVDAALFRYPYDAALIGQTLYFKCPSFNVYGGAPQDLSDAIEHAYVIAGPLGAPDDVGGFSAAVNPYEISISWDGDPATDLNTYEVWEGAAFGSGTQRLVGKTNKLAILPRGAGTYGFHIKAIDRGGKKSRNAQSVSVVIAAIAAPSVTAVVEGTDAIFSLTPPTTQFAVEDAEVRYGASFAAGTSLGRFKGTRFKTPINWVGARTFWFAVTDAGGQTGAAGSSALTITAPAAPVVSASMAGPDFRATWTVPSASLPIAEYEVRHGASYAAGTFVARLKGTDLQRRVDWGGSRTLWVCGYDANANEGTPGSVSLNVSAPSAGVLTHQVIDNNILLYWTEVPGTLPIATHEIARGATYAGATVIGTKSGQFTSLFETQAGTYTYWDTPIDTAGNRGTPASVAATVSQPPDYVLQGDFDSAFGGTRSNALLAGGVVTLPVNTTETWTQHFVNNAWTTPQAQISAGYPVFIEPSSSSGYYEEVIDYGSTLAASKITVAATYQTVAGTPVVAVTISTSADGSSYSSPVTGTELFATAFRYAKIRFAVTSSGGDDIVTLTALNVRLDVKLKTEVARMTCASGDSGGTTYTFVQSFLDVTTIDVTAFGTTAITAVVSFTDAPNPTSCKVLLFNDAGTRVTADASITIKGY